jgi:hypothetical protein
MSRQAQAQEKCRARAGRRETFSIAAPGAIQLKLDVEAATRIADSGDPEQDVDQELRGLRQTISRRGLPSASASAGAFRRVEEVVTTRNHSAWFH